ncbi:hypothetical protein H5410_020040 [Solanum commersonii]|uniref:Uncharacterized protein n=1 Tax=Solanum commersonii TaxID=4109 RepID=A0A9J5ZA27_SOLCO|nr:hypothetical protein H5410_020040 [Solanum commersonii]
MRGVICVELVASRSMQQYNNSYKELFSQIKIARELRGFGLIRGKITILSPPQSNKESHMRPASPMKPPPPTPPPSSPPSLQPPPPPSIS